MTEENSLILILIVGTVGMLLLAGSIVFFVVYYQKKMLQNKMNVQELETAYQKQLLFSTIESQEKERKRIAADLHDGVGAMLSAAKLNLGMIYSGAIPKEEIVEAVSDTKSMIDETIDNVRRISKDLLPSSLDAFGLSRAIDELCEKLSNIKTKVQFKEYGDSPLSKEHELLVYRCIQELINNALKHANASVIEVIADWGTPINITVKDNGIGFNAHQKKQDINKGVGLYNIENRASLIGGTVSFDSDLDQGTGITIVIEA